MSFLIDNVYSYLQVDVLEDFEQVRELHDKYLSSITEQCFLNLNQVLKAFQDVLHMCSLLCRLLKKIDPNNMEEIKEEFDKIKIKFEA